MCVCVCMCLCIFRYSCAQAYGSQGTTSVVIPQSASTFSFFFLILFFLRQFLVSLELTRKAGWLHSRSLLCLPPQHWDYKRTPPCLPGQTQVLMLLKQALYILSNFPSTCFTKQTALKSHEVLWLGEAVGAKVPGEVLPQWAWWPFRTFSWPSPNKDIGSLSAGALGTFQNVTRCL